MPRSVVDLHEIIHPIEEHLSQFDRHFRDAIRSRIGLVDLVTRYILRQKGKRIRPVLVLLSAEMCGGINQRSYRGAALVEILHTATLVHDDVVDDADTRRGIASVNAIWKNKIAVLMGDYLLARGLLLSLDHNDFDFLKITSNAVRRMSEGELNQIARARKLDMDEAGYLRVIGDKTASLLSTCCEIGATSATSELDTHRRLREYGELIGLAFQIRDDILDYTGRKSITGKPTGLDLSEKKLTLPLIHSLASAPQKEGKAILGMIKSGGKKMKVREIVAFVTDHGGIAYATERARCYAEQAQELIAGFPESPAKTSLYALAEFMVARQK
jgi:octaprenyl-diphosphate synthase